MVLGQVVAHSVSSLPAPKERSGSICFLPDRAKPQVRIRLTPGFLLLPGVGKGALTVALGDVPGWAAGQGRCNTPER